MQLISSENIQRDISELYKQREAVEIRTAVVTLALCMNVGMFRDVPLIMWFFIACAIGLQIYKEHTQRYVKRVIRGLEMLQSVIISIGVSNG